MTAYGFQVLSSLSMGLRTDVQGLRKIEIVMERLHLNIVSKSVTTPINNPLSQMSDAMRSLLLKRALGKPKKSRRKSAHN
jgi:hypothetical protein